MCKQSFIFLIALLFFAGHVQAASVATKKNVEPPVSLTLTVDKYTDSIPKETLDQWARQSNEYSISQDTKAEFENTQYCPTNKIFCDLTLTTAQRSRFHLTPQTTINTENIRSHLEDLARKANRDPADAKFKVENGKVVTFLEAENGVTLDVEKSLKAITEKLSNSEIKSAEKLALPFDSKKPATNYGDVNNMGISSLIGQGVSDFKGSPKNRMFNIRVATQRFDGLLIKPGEEFSFVKILGEVDGEHGYLPELVIKQGVTEPEFGGGVCQVSTTAFRAAINSGLKITARRNHAYPVSYYLPHGMDSTVYVPNPDLRFINNTPNYILFQAKITGTILTFSFYGTDDGRKITIDGPRITERQPDGALKTTFTQKVVDKDGNEIINDVFNSSYASPYKYPHLGGPTLSVKPSNWSEDEWKAYKKTLKDLAKAAPKTP
jgi:vancomycin resistance protein YoaR